MNLFVNSFFRHFFVISAFCVFFLAFSSNGWAVQLPPSWPWRGVSMGFPDAQPSDVKKYREQLGINAIRLQLKTRHYALKAGVNASKARQDGFDWADRMLDECDKNGVMAIINVSHFPTDPSKPNQRSEEFWADEGAVAGALSEIEMVVSHFRNRGGDVLVAYDFMSEPVMQTRGRTVRPPKWPNMMSKIVDMVAKMDSRRWVVVSPGPWGGPAGYKNFTPPLASKVILGVHMYLPHHFTHQHGTAVSYPGRVSIKYWDKERLRDSFEALRSVSHKTGLPVLVGEFSSVRWAPGGEQYLIDLTSIFNENGWGWLYFTAAGWHGWDPDYSQVYPGKDEGLKWQNTYIGNESARWKTLRGMFGEEVEKGVK